MATLRHPTIRQNPKLGIVPTGTLLDFNADLDRDFGFAFERFLNFSKDRHSHERFVFCAARMGCSFKVTELSSGKVFTNSPQSSVFKAPHSLHALRCEQTVYENLVFLPTTALVREQFDRLGYPSVLWDSLIFGIRELPRSEWFNALTERYFKKRLFWPNETSSLKFLEHEILSEILVMALGDPSKTVDRLASDKDQVSDPIRRAIESIEASLFSKLNLSELAAEAGLSRAVFCRNFRDELQLSPMAYVRQRKLEEAKSLLEKKRHTVSEVSFLVGYEDTSAFCRAYKSHYGSSPKAAPLS